MNYNIIIVVNNVLEWQKLTAKKNQIDENDFEMRQLVQDVVSSFRCLLSYHNLSVNIHVSPAVPPLIRSDRFKVQQILINYLSNAAKYSPKSSMINLQVSADTDRHIVTVLVQDEGNGVPIDLQPKLFQRFSRLGQHSSDRVSNGSGIGLSVCRQLSEILGGSAWYEDKGKFFFSFAYKLCDASTAIPCSAEFKQQTLSPNTLTTRATNVNTANSSSNLNTTSINVAKWSPVLVAEDNLINQKVMLKMLKKIGFSPQDIVIKGDGEQALLAVEQQPQSNSFNLILMDISMPKVDGIEATMELRRRGCATVIIGVSANAMVEQKDTALAAGMDGFLVKPAQSGDIQRLLSSMEMSNMQLDQ